MGDPQRIAKLPLGLHVRVVEENREAHCQRQRLTVIRVDGLPPATPQLRGELGRKLRQLVVVEGSIRSRSEQEGQQRIGSTVFGHEDLGVLRQLPREFADELQELAHRLVMGRHAVAALDAGQGRDVDEEQRTGARAL